MLIAKLDSNWLISCDTALKFMVSDAHFFGVRRTRLKLAKEFLDRKDINMLNTHKYFYYTVIGYCTAQKLSVKGVIKI